MREQSWLKWKGPKVRIRLRIRMFLPRFQTGEVASLRAGGGGGHAEPNQDCTGSSPNPDKPAFSRVSARSTPTRLLDRMSSDTDSPSKLVESVARYRCHAPRTVRRDLEVLYVCHEKRRLKERDKLAQQAWGANVAPGVVHTNQLDQRSREHRFAN